MYDEIYENYNYERDVISELLLHSTVTVGMSIDSPIGIAP